LNINYIKRVDVMSVIDFEAAKRWNRISQKTKQFILENVFCSTCGITKLVEYTLHNDDSGIILKGKCSKCGMNVTRFIENYRQLFFFFHPGYFINIPLLIKCVFVEELEGTIVDIYIRVAAFFNYDKIMQIVSDLISV